MAEYNNTGVVRTLVGNWQEERGLKAATGTARCQVCVFVVEQVVRVTVFCSCQSTSQLCALLPSLVCAADRQCGLWGSQHRCPDARADL